MKKFLSIIIFLVALIGFTKNSFAQTQAQDEQLALFYFNNSEFDKAVTLYEKLWNKYPLTITYYNNYYKTLLQLKQYDDAEKVVKKQLKKFPAELTEYVDLGYIQQLKEKQKDAQASFSEAIKKMYPDALMITKLANAFISINKFDEALEVYKQAGNLIGDETMFINEQATIYASKGDAMNVIKLYLDLLDKNPNTLSEIENRLQDFMTQKAYQTEIQTQLYKKIAKSDQSAYADLLIWYFIQQKDYANAFLQVKAMDKRNKEDGSRIFQLAQSAFAEGEYKMADEGYQYIIDTKGISSPLYMMSRMEQLNVLKTQIAVGNLSQPELIDIEKKYQQFLVEFGRNTNTLNVLKDYAALEARYMNKIDTAIAVLEAIIHEPNYDKISVAECKIDLADYYLLSGNVWDSQLLYMQVDKDFKDEPIAEEARFRNAKLSYYKGEFEWAQAQLDIIKGATHEFISNDAIALSVFILDNSGLDSITTPLLMYAQADLLLFQHKYIEAMNALDTLEKNYPDHALMDDVLFEKAMICLQQKKYQEAVNLFDDVDAKFSSDLLGDDALFKVAELYEKQLNNKDKAMELYKTIITKYPGSLYVIEARKRYRELRGDNLN